jgi:hypothetical protein
MQFKAHSIQNYTITTKGHLLCKQTRASARIDHPVGRIVVYNTTGAARTPGIGGPATKPN